LRFASDPQPDMDTHYFIQHMLEQTQACHKGMQASVALVCIPSDHSTP
jgi:hypothetical protein